MSIRLTPDEAWRVIEGSHTGVLTTLKADGTPISLPTWFVVIDRAVCTFTPNRAKKLARIRRNPRAAFLVESGERWAELCAVHLTGTVAIVDDQEAIERIDDALDDKYRAFKSGSAMPAKTADHYAQRTFLRFTPDERMLTWDNSRIPLGE